jgi:formylglycine-generating enzyme required for sulfatase activity
MRRVFVALAAATATAWLAACSLTLSFDGIADGTGDAIPPEGSVDGTVGGGSPDAGDAEPADTTLSTADAFDAGAAAPDASDATSVSGDGGTDGVTGTTDAGDAARGDGGCVQGTAGAVMVSAGEFCIDSTEVTLGQYTAFLTAKGGDTSGQPAHCQWNSSYTPTNAWPPPPSAPSDQAMRGVDWCDAYMYCEWAGKRLCGNSDGGSSDPLSVSDPTVSQWFRACSHNKDGVHAYPYGLTYRPSACNGVDYDAGGPLPSLSTCAGAYPGLFDMSGNVIEWEDSCWPTPTSPDAGDTSGAGDFCNIRGGGFGQGAPGLTCDSNIATIRSNGGGDNGFRCCSK